MCNLLKMMNKSRKCIPTFMGEKYLIKFVKIKVFYRKL